MNGYVCYCLRLPGQRKEVYAPTQHDAVQKALSEFQKGTRKKLKSWDISTVLAEKSGEAVTHTPDF